MFSGTSCSFAQHGDRREIFKPRRSLQSPRRVLCSGSGRQRDRTRVVPKRVRVGVRSRSIAPADPRVVVDAHVRARTDRGPAEHRTVGRVMPGERDLARTEDGSRNVRGGTATHRSVRRTQETAAMRARQWRARSSRLPLPLWFASTGSRWACHRKSWRSAPIFIAPRGSEAGRSVGMKASRPIEGGASGPRRRTHFIVTVRRDSGCHACRAGYGRCRRHADDGRTARRLRLESCGDQAPIRLAVCPFRGCWPTDLQSRRPGRSDQSELACPPTRCAHDVGRCPPRTRSRFFAATSEPPSGQRDIAGASLVFRSPGLYVL